MGGEEGGGGGSATYERVVQLLNDAQKAGDASSLVQLKQVKELLIHQSEDLLDSFLDEFLAFQNDRNPDVRRFVLGFIEEACKKDQDVLPKVMPNLAYMFGADENHNVLKRIILVISHLYPLALNWMGSVKQPSAEMQRTWEELKGLKTRIVPLIDGDNDGIRTHAIKFLEAVILSQSPRTPNSESKPDSYALNMVPRDHRTLSYRQLENEGKTLFQKLVELLAIDHITAINLMTTMGALTNIARQRPELAFADTMTALETLHVNLPPTLAKSQVASTRKSLKAQLLQMLRHPSATPFHPQITTLLTDLGATQAQVIKALPPGSELRRAMRRGDAPDEPPPPKRVKEEEEAEDDDEEKSGAGQAVQATAAWLYPRLENPAAVARIVLAAMPRLPDAMPPAFQSSYTPIAAAGTEAQKRHLCRLIGTQLTAAGLGPGADEERRKAAIKAATAAATASSGKASSAFHTHAAEEPSPAPNPAVPTPKPTPVYGVTQSSKSSKRFHQMGLVHMTRPMDSEQVKTVQIAAFHRIVAAEKRAMQGGVAGSQVSLLVRMAARFEDAGLQEALLGFVLADVKTRADLALTWIYEAYAAYRGFNGQKAGEDKATLQGRYDRTLSTFLSILLSRGEHKDTLFHKLIREAPLITESALGLLRQACLDSVYGSFCLSTLKEIILTRPKQRGEFLYTLLEFTFFQQLSFRMEALTMAKEIYANPAIAQDIRLYVSRSQLRLLLEPSPPLSLFGKERGRAEATEGWTEESVKACLYLCFFLLPLDQALIHDLAAVYVQTTPDVKRVILRQLEFPMKTIGVNSPELLRLVEECPEGAETLVTRVVHLLTERSPPTRALVDKVKELHLSRVPDVRCLIPVLTGLSKNEILVALPKLVALNEKVVKEVLNRLLFGKSLESSAPPMGPGELLLTLHTLPPESEAAVLGAMGQLLDMRAVFTKDVVSGVIQQLLDREPHPPPLLTKTMSAAVAIYPQLLGFIINVLQRLVQKEVLELFRDKKVWGWPSVWPGFIAATVAAAPHSFPVLLHMPPERLRDLLAEGPAHLRPKLKAHIDNLPSQQHGQIAEEIRAVVEAKPAAD